MSYPLRSQINLWWQTVSSEETLNTYQKTIQTTWNILRETTKLLWLFLCLGLVFVDWLRDFATQSGQQVKIWIDRIEEPKAENIWKETSTFFTSISRSGITTALGQAREQLGLAMPEARPLAASAVQKPQVVASLSDKPESPSPTRVVEPEPELNSDDAAT